MRARSQKSVTRPDVTLVVAGTQNSNKQTQISNRLRKWLRPTPTLVRCVRRFARRMRKLARRMRKLMRD